MKRKFWLLGTALFAVNPCAHAENSEMLVKPFLNPIIGLTVLVACIFFVILTLSARFRSIYPSYSGRILWSLIAFPLLFVGVNIVGMVSSFICAFYDIAQIKMPFVVSGLIHAFALYAMINLMRKKDIFLFSWRRESVVQVPRLIKDMLNVSIWATFFSVLVLCVSSSTVIIEFGATEAKALLVGAVTCIMQLISSILIIWLAERRAHLLSILFGYHGYSHSGKTDFPSEIEGFQF